MTGARALEPPMPTDLESQLRASLPGRETAVQDYKEAAIARREVELAIELLHAATARIRVALGDDRKAAVNAAEAELWALKARLDLDTALKAHPAGKAPR